MCSIYTKYTRLFCAGNTVRCNCELIRNMQMHVCRLKLRRVFGLPRQSRSAVSALAFLEALSPQYKFRSTDKTPRNCIRSIVDAASKKMKRTKIDDLYIPVRV